MKLSETNSWNKLQEQSRSFGSTHMRALFEQDPGRL